MNHFAFFLIKDIIKRKHRRINAFCEEIKKYEGGKLYVKNKCDDGTIIIWEHFGLMEDDLESMENIEDIVNRIILKRKVW